MGPNFGAAPGFVGQLVEHAGTLQRAARCALEEGDYARAAALIDDAELLAEDVHALVDAIEARDSGALTALAALGPVAAAAAAVALAAPVPEKPARPFFALPARGVRAALGTSIAMSLALTEC